VFELLPEGARDALANALSVLTNKGIWVRFGTAFAGIALMLIGVTILLRGSVAKVGTTVARAVI
jgi:hypothetical protein